MKYSNAAIKELTARYRAVLKKCALIAATLFIGIGTASADVTVVGATVYGGADATATVTDTTTEVTRATEGQALADQINANTTAIGTNTANIQANTAAIANKANSADVYTKSETDSAISDAVDALANGQVATNKNAIADINATIGTTQNGTYIGSMNTIGDNLGALDAQVTANTANIGTVGSINSANGDTVTTTTVSEAVGELDAKLGTFADVSGDYVDGTKTVAENLNSLNNAIGSKADISGGSYNAANGLTDTKTVNQNLTALSDTIGDKTKLSNGADNITGTTVVGAINDLDAKIGNDSELTSDYNGVGTSNTVKANINAINTAIGDLEQVGNNVDSNGKTITGNLAAPGSSVVDNLNALDARLGQINGLADAIIQNGGTYYGNLSGGSTVADHLVELDAAIGDLQQTGVRGENIAAQLQTLGNDLQNLENEVRGGFAASAALSALVPNARATNDTQISLGTGMYRDRAGFAIGAFHYVNDNVLLNAGAAYGGSKSTTLKAAITFGW